MSFETTVDGIQIQSNEELSEKECRAYIPVLNSFESVKMSQTLYLKALGLFFARP